VINSKLERINKDSNKPKTSAFKRPTLHTQTVVRKPKKKKTYE
tara:strand:- start:116 stop:244 length:129 start_codon:yes stop_codon:yes gene_type:complete